MPCEPKPLHCSSRLTAGPASPSLDGTIAIKQRTENPNLLMRRLLFLAGVIGAGWTAGTPSLAAVGLGDPAPPLKISQWIKGQPVDLAAAKGSNICVVEFWATWCGPCRVSIPHLTALQKKFKGRGVVFVGISDEKLEVVKKFVDEMGDKMDYTVALDQDGKSSAGYMRAFNINGIPHAFVVDKEGRFAWHGHPMDRLEEVLQELADGKYDLAVAKKRERGQTLLTEFYQLAGAGNDEAKLDQMARELDSLNKDVELMPGKKFDTAEIRKQARFNVLMNAYGRALFEDRGAAQVEEAAKRAEAMTPSGVNFVLVKNDIGLRVMWAKYLRLVTGEGGGDEAKAASLATQLGATASKNPELLNEVAWAILTHEKIKKRDLPLALKLAQAAFDSCEGKDANIVDTYARALFDNGKAGEAIACQKKAVALASAPGQKAQLEATLKEYEAKAGK